MSKRSMDTLKTLKSEVHYTFVFSVVPAESEVIYSVSCSSVWGFNFKLKPHKRFKIIIIIKKR